MPRPKTKFQISDDELTELFRDRIAISKREAALKLEKDELSNAIKLAFEERQADELPAPDGGRFTVRVQTVKTLSKDLAPTVLVNYGIDPDDVQDALDEMTTVRDSKVLNYYPPPKTKSTKDPKETLAERKAKRGGKSGRRA